MMSACVKWAKEEVDAFNAILARQLSGEKEGGEAWASCMNTAKEHAGLLSEVGLDFRNMVGQSAKAAVDSSSSSSSSSPPSSTNAPAGLGLVMGGQAA
jgi:hypothetical protein